MGVAATDVPERVLTTLAEALVVPREELSLDTDILGDLDVSSLDLAQLVFMLEDEFDVVVPDDVIPSLVTIGDVVEYIRNSHQDATKHGKRPII